MTSAKTLGPMVAGSWYPGEPTGLRRALDDYLDGSARVRRAPAALIVPHAGYVYSGSVAGRGFAGLRGAGVERVWLLGPSHRHGFRGARLPRARGYRTPLGEIAIDRPSVSSLAELEGFELDDAPFDGEHSLEMELPFLQHLLEPGWSLVPLLLGAASRPEDLDAVAEGLDGLRRAGEPVVVSSDFTHYGRGFGYVPFEDSIESGIRELDLGAIDRFRRADAHGFDDYCDRTGATICGRHPIGVLLRMQTGARCKGRLAAYDLSGNITGDWSHSVSYASITFEPADETVA